MALSKKNSRLIEVAAVEYRWAFSMDSGYATIVVQHAEGAGQRLEAQTGPWNPGDPRALTPTAIAALIKYAQTQGWAPALAGPPLRLRDIEQSIDLVD